MAKYRILITGSREFSDTQRMLDVFMIITKYFAPHEVTLVHGGARGADSIAGQLAHTLGWNTEVHPAKWDEYGKKAGSIRNQVMVDSGADICLAFPIGPSYGTRHCIRSAQKANIHTFIYEG